MPIIPQVADSLQAVLVNSADVAMFCQLLCLHCADATEVLNHNRCYFGKMSNKKNRITNHLGIKTHEVI